MRLSLFVFSTALTLGAPAAAQIVKEPSTVSGRAFELIQEYRPVLRELCIGASLPGSSCQTMDFNITDNAVVSDRSYCSGDRSGGTDEFPLADIDFDYSEETGFSSFVCRDSARCNRNTHTGPLSYERDSFMAVVICREPERAFRMLEAIAEAPQ